MNGEYYLKKCFKPLTYKIREIFNVNLRADIQLTLLKYCTGLYTLFSIPYSLYINLHFLNASLVNCIACLSYNLPLSLMTTS